MTDGRCRHISDMLFLENRFQLRRNEPLEMFDEVTGRYDPNLASLTITRFCLARDLTDPEIKKVRKFLRKMLINGRRP